MKVAITSQGKTEKDQVDPRFGRAQQFIILDTEKKGFEIVDNFQNFNSAQGAGIQAAQNIVNTGVDVLITGHCGPKAFKALSAANIKIYTGATGTVDNVFSHFKDGKLKKSDNADVEGHW